MSAISRRVQVCSVFFGISLFVLSSQTLHHPWKRKQTSIVLILVSHWRKDFFVYLCKDILSSSVFSFSSLNTLCLSWWSSIRLSSPSLCHIFFPHIPSPSFPLRTYRAGIDTSFRVLCFSCCSSSFPFLDFLKSQWACFHWWVFLYRKVRERWVMQVPRCFCAHFFKNFCRFAYQNFSLVRWMKKYPQILVICNSSVFPLRSSIIKLQ